MLLLRVYWLWVMLRQEKCCCYGCWCLACRRWVCWWSVLWLCTVNAEAACVCCWRMLFLCMQMLRLLMTCAVDLHADAACVVDVCCCCSPCLATHLRRYWKVIAFLNFTALHLSFQKLYCFVGFEDMCLHKMYKFFSENFLLTRLVILPKLRLKIKLAKQQNVS